MARQKVCLHTDKGHAWVVVVFGCLKAVTHSNQCQPPIATTAPMAREAGAGDAAAPPPAASMAPAVSGLPPPQLLRTDFNCFAVRFSPFEEGKFAVATSQYFGIIGNGQLLVCSGAGTAAPLGEMRRYLTADGIFDVAWNELNENQVVTSSADGSVKLWDLHSPDAFPIARCSEHAQECVSVDWNLVDKRTFLTASWDHTVKLWDPAVARSVATYTDHTFCAYAAMWSPQSATVFATASGDRSIKLFDTKAPSAVQSIAPAHGDEILCLDWNKYHDNVLATGSVDKTINLWDLRRPDGPTASLMAHGMAVKRLKWSPHNENVLASASYDMSVCLWDIGSGSYAPVQKADHHTEFVCGLDFHLFQPGLIASAAWDRSVCMWHIGAGAPPPIAKLPGVVGTGAGPLAGPGAGVGAGAGVGGDERR